MGEVWWLCVGAVRWVAVGAVVVLRVALACIAACLISQMTKTRILLSVERGYVVCVRGLYRFLSQCIELKANIMPRVYAWTLHVVG